MFESSEIGHRIGKEAYRKAVPELRAALLAAQVDLYENSKFPVLVLVSGQDGAGKGETINLLCEWMDPRFIATMAFAESTDEERERPPMWRFWRALPPKGRFFLVRESLGRLIVRSVALGSLLRFLLCAHKNTPHTE